MKYFYLGVTTLSLLIGIVLSIADWGCAIQMANAGGLSGLIVALILGVLLPDSRFYLRVIVLWGATALFLFLPLPLINNPRVGFLDSAYIRMFLIGAIVRLILLRRKRFFTWIPNSTAIKLLLCLSIWIVVRNLSYLLAWLGLAIGWDIPTHLEMSTLRVNRLAFSVSATAWVMLWGALIFQAVDDQTPEHERRAFCQVVAWTLFAVAIWAVVHYSVYPTASYYQGYHRLRIGELLPVEAGVTGTLFALFYLNSAHWRKVLVGWAASLFIAILCLSRTALIGLLVGLVLTRVENHSKWHERRNVRIIMTGVMVAVILACTSIAFRKSYFERYLMIDFGQKTDRESRSSYYRWATQKIVRHPVIGLGAPWGESYALEGDSTMTAIISHSFILDLGLLGGGIAVVLWIAALVARLREIIYIKNDRIKFIPLFGALLVINCFSSSMMVPFAGFVAIMICFGTRSVSRTHIEQLTNG